MCIFVPLFSLYSLLPSNSPRIFTITMNSSLLSNHRFIRIYHSRSFKRIPINLYPFKRYLFCKFILNINNYISSLKLKNTVKTTSKKLLVTIDHWRKKECVHFITSKYCLESFFLVDSLITELSKFEQATFPEMSQFVETRKNDMVI